MDGSSRDVDLRRLRYFVAVAEELHFGRAAERLHMSTPPLSQRIRELEGRLGFPLFERTSRRVALTPAGERLLADAREVLRAVERFDANAAALAAAPAPCRIGHCHGSEGGVMRAYRAFLAERPDAVLRLEGLTSLRILDGLRAGRLAVGVLRGPVVDPGRSAATPLVSAPLARVPIDHVAVPADHLLAGHREVHAADLDGEPVLIVERADAPTHHDVITGYCRSMDVRPRWVTHAPVQVERELDLVAVGAGIAWLNSWQADQAGRRDDVVVRPLVPVAIVDELHIAWRADDPSSTTVAFVDTARATCA